MRVKVASIFRVTLIGILVSASVGGCAETMMTPAERVKIHTLCLSPRMGNKLTYLRKGTTVFQTYEESLDDNGMLAWVAKATGDLLRSAGYAVVEQGQACDYDLVITPVMSYAKDGMGAVKGAGFYVRSYLSITAGIEVHSFFVFDLVRPGTSEIRFHGRLYYPIRQSNIGAFKNVPWNELSPDERARLMKMLQDQLWTVPGHGVRGLGLM
jgi:hypothetical protein